FLYLPMMRRPPSSTLFPYRRSSDLAQAPARVVAGDRAHLRIGRARRRGVGHAQPQILPDALGLLAQCARRVERGRDQREGPLGRSEEHTSELQSLAYLVCRLLLEKK